MSEHPVARLSLLLPWFMIACGVPVILWWTFEPSPIRVTYVAPAFLTSPAQSREDAARFYTYETNLSVLWRYVEYCVDKPFAEGTSHRSWVGRAIVWHAPDLPTYLARTPGCTAANVAVDIPSSSPARDFRFVQWIEIPLNPIRTATVQFDPIPLRILESKQ
jgi:hypothetical protein